MGTYQCQDCKEQFKDIEEYTNHLMLHSEKVRTRVQEKKKSLFGRIKDVVRFEVDDPHPVNPEFTQPELKPPVYKDTREREVLEHMEMNRHFLDMSLSMQKMERLFENLSTDVQGLHKEVRGIKDGKRVEQMVQQVTQPEPIKVEPIPPIVVDDTGWEDPPVSVGQKVHVKLECGSFKKNMEVWNVLAKAVAPLNVELINQE